MVLILAEWQWHEPTPPPRWLARSLLVRAVSMRLRPVLVGLDGFCLSRPGFDGSKSGRGQRVCRSPATPSLASSAPTSELSGYLNSRFWVAASLATLLPPMRWLVCCNDRWNPSAITAAHTRITNFRNPPYSGHPSYMAGSFSMAGFLEQLAVPFDRSWSSVVTFHEGDAIPLRRSRFLINPSPSQRGLKLLSKVASTSSFCLSNRAFT